METTMNQISRLLPPANVLVNLAFDAPDGKPVSLLIFLLVPEQATQFHLELLSELAQMLSEKNFRESLLQAETSSDLHRLMVNWEPNRAAA